MPGGSTNTTQNQDRTSPYTHESRQVHESLPVTQPAPVAVRTALIEVTAAVGNTAGNALLAQGEATTLAAETFSGAPTWAAETFAGSLIADVITGVQELGAGNGAVIGQGESDEVPVGMVLVAVAMVLHSNDAQVALGFVNVHMHTALLGTIHEV